MTRGSRTKSRDTAERRCIATGVSQPTTGLIRFVVGPDNQIVPDLAGKLPGRGIWVSANSTALNKAVAKKLFARAARQTVVIPEGLVVQTEALLVKHVIGLLSLARKSGDAITGFEKVKEAVISGSVTVLLQACDGSDGQKSKIRPPSGNNTLISCLFGYELGLAFGRENVIHAALAAGGLTDRVVDEASRLAGFRLKTAPDGADASGMGPEQEGVEDE